MILNDKIPQPPLRKGEEDGVLGEKLNQLFKVMALKEKGGNAKVGERENKFIFYDYSGLIKGGQKKHPVAGNSSKKIIAKAAKKVKNKIQKKGFSAEFQNWQKEYEKIGKEVDLKIKEVLDLSVSKNIQNIVNYQIDSGGKRLRPILAILSCLICDGKTKDILYPAAGLEILHNYSLIIDDLIDNSRLRRRKLTLWAKYGTSVSECISIDYAVSIFQTANRSEKRKEIIEAFAKMIKTLAEGEITDMLFEMKNRNKESYVAQNRYLKITLEDYFKMIEKKTAVFFETCCEIGGLCSNATEAQIMHLKNVGLNLGMAGQIKDDILDIFGEEKKPARKPARIYKKEKEGISLFFLQRKHFLGWTENNCAK